MSLDNDADEYKAMLAAIVNSSDDAIISKSLDGIITSWNKAAERMFGYLEHEAIGKHISILIPTERQSEEDKIISSIRAGKRVEHYQTVRLTKEGKEINISLTVSPIINAQNKIIGASKIARDITKQKEAEELNKQYANSLEIINSTGRTIAAELDVQEILQKVTDVTTKLSGAAFGAFFYNKKDSNGEAYLLYSLSGAPREAFEKFGTPRITELFGVTFNGEAILRSDDITKDTRYGKNSPHSGMPKGHLPVVSYLAVPVISQTGTVIGGLFFGHPKSAMFKKQHEILVEAIAAQAGIALDNAMLYEEIRLLNEKKDDFIGFASHELKTPLTTINGYLQLAEEMPSLSEEILPKIKKQVSRLSTMIADLLDISKIHTDHFEINFLKTNLSSLIKDSVEVVKQLDGNKHTIKYNLPVEDIILNIDKQKMEQVLINLLTNAIKYSDDGTHVQLTAVAFGDQMRISVADEGVGIGSKHLNKIFSRFYRISTSGKKMPGGSGLGLFISKEIIEGHHGKIWAESVEGKGSTFNIVFPINAQKISATPK
ncbi:MAG TPA: PAS domain S-box protein [Puia sp.]|jgi:PAS domain S-box-containing protein|nr:PAS domain S-box protein [Puia sp.]